MYFNCRSILPKIDELAALCSTNNPDIVCLVETWLCGNILNNELYIPNYSIIRHDRNRHGGGVAIYIHNSIKYQILMTGPANLELLVVSLFRNNFKLCLGVFYRPPSSSHYIFDTLCDALFTIDQSHFSNFVLVGDFNVNFDSSHPLYSHLSDFMVSFSLSQIVESPTHYSHSGQPSLIDLVFVSDVSYFCTCSVIPNLANSDHLGLLVSLKHRHSARIPTCRRQVWRYKHADFIKANDISCDIVTSDILDPTDIQISWSRFKRIFLEVMEECIPRSVLPDRKNLPWMSKEIVQLIRKRNLFFTKADHSGDIGDRLKFKQLRNKVVAKLRNAKRDYLSKINPREPKEFWKIVKSLDSKENSLPVLKSGDTTASSDLEKANLLNTTFVNNFNHLVPGLSLGDISDVPVTDCPIEFLCTEEEVYELLFNLDAMKANGPDDISAKMLKETALSIAPIVTQLFNISIILGELPNEWKMARVSPIPKSGDHSDPGNYRPISLLSLLSKLLEKHIQNLLAKHFEENYPISAQQWGFARGKSTTGALLDVTDHWHKLLEQRHDICSVFLTIVKHLTRYHIFHCYASSSSMVFIHRY